jgi:alkanesulfonate monooxygenase SsuD/methylene tetrahydromethanopterin reductase-like flavin-dependent oxidoreductase (luciferase family)
LEQNDHVSEDEKVAVMLHTFIADDIEKVIDTVRIPFLNYLKSTSDLDKFKYEESGQNPEDIPTEMREQMLKEYMFRFINEVSLIGTTSSCIEMVNKLSDIGVDEFACLVDFGISQDEVISGLTKLKNLKELSKK